MTVQTSGKNDGDDEFNDGCLSKLCQGFHPRLCLLNNQLPVTLLYFTVSLT